MATDEALRALPAPGSLRVAVASDQHLVAESVLAALRNRGHDAVGVRWPSIDDSIGHATVGQSRPGLLQRGAGPPPDVAVLLSDLTRLKQVRGAQLLIGAIDIPWLVLAGVTRGPQWGALYESGARLVVSTDIGLDELCGLLGGMDADRGRQLGPDRSRDLIKAWRNHARHQGELTARVKTLTGRENEVLEQLYEGMGVRRIAERGSVSEATVRSQVKAILRKLEVNSQLAAVATYQQVRGSTSQAVSLAGLPADVESARSS